MKISKVFGIVLSLHVGVILLVMFQPSCQTTGGTAKTSSEEQNSLPSEGGQQSFNQAIEGVDEPTTNTTLNRKPEEFAAPKRPVPGELIIPEETNLPADSKQSIIVPSENAIRPIDLKPSDLAIYKVVRGDTLWGIARKNGVSLADLLKANPNLDKSGRLSIGQEIMVPGISGTVTTPFSGGVDADQTDTELGANSYQVVKGDTLSLIARKHNVRLSELLIENGMSMSSIIRPGQRLKIPGQATGQRSESTQSSETPSRIVPSGASTHIVKKGENLSRISAIYGVSVAQIMEWNGLSNPSLIRAGQPLIISQSVVQAPEESAIPSAGSDALEVPSDEGNTLQDFFNDSSSEDRPIIDAP